MKRIVYLALGAALALPVALSAQSSSQAIEKALSPISSERSREAASVIRWNADYSWTFLKEAEGPIVCYDRSDEPGRAPFAVQCTSKENLPRVAQSRRFQFEGNGDRGAVRELVAAAEADGSRVAPEYGSVWLSMNGQDMASAGVHTTIAVPFATAESTGFPTSGAQGGVWLMDAGTSTAHLMTPAR